MLTAGGESEKGEAMPVTVTVKDSAGNTVPNVEFTLKRGEASPRNAGANVVWQCGEWRWTIHRSAVIWLAVTLE